MTAQVCPWTPDQVKGVIDFTLWWLVGLFACYHIIKAAAKIWF